MIARLRQRRPFDICLNVIFVVWALYFVVTGYVIPQPLIRHATRPPVAEKRQADPPPDNLPVLVLDQDS